jgi:hypothetical protein
MTYYEKLRPAVFFGTAALFTALSFTPASAAAGAEFRLDNRTSSEFLMLVEGDGLTDGNVYRRLLVVKPASVEQYSHDSKGGEGRQTMSRTFSIWRGIETSSLSAPVTTRSGLQARGGELVGEVEVVFKSSAKGDDDVQWGAFDDVDGDSFVLSKARGASGPNTKVLRIREE